MKGVVLGSDPHQAHVGGAGPTTTATVALTPMDVGGIGSGGVHSHGVHVHAQPMVSAMHMDTSFIFSLSPEEVESILRSGAL